MRSPLTKTVRRDAAESQLNLPPGFRFHPTDEELIVHYLRPKTQSTWSTTHPSIIADVDIYKHQPWELPEMALFGTKEWYFFTPRDRKYPNGSRPNRVTGHGYWKATGADKPIKSKSETIGIKKAMVFYAGRGVKGIKTNWIMHEYRLAASKLDEWVLCRLYNKKNNPKEMIILLPHQEEEEDNNNIHHPLQSPSDSDGEFGTTGSFEGDVTFSDLTKVEDASEQSSMGLMMQKEEDIVDDDWLHGLTLEDLHEAMPTPHDLYDMPIICHSNQLYFF